MDIQVPAAADEFLEVPLDLIDPDPEQPRKTFRTSDIRELADSIRNVGMVQPVLVRKNGDRFILIAGERRFRAMQLLERETINAIVRSLDDPHTLRLLQLVENEDREPLTALELALAIRADIDETGISAGTLADQLGWSKAKVSDHLTVSRAPSYVHHFGKEFFVRAPKRDTDEQTEEGERAMHDYRRPPLSFVHLTLLARFDKSIKKVDAARKKEDGGARTLNAEKLVRRMGERASMQEWSRRRLEDGIKAELDKLAAGGPRGSAEPTKAKRARSFVTKDRASFTLADLSSMEAGQKDLFSKQLTELLKDHFQTVVISN